MVLRGTNEIGRPFQNLPRHVRRQVEQILRAVTVSNESQNHPLDSRITAYQPMQPLQHLRRQTPCRWIASLSHALASRRALKFYYRKPGQKCANLRQVHPYHLMCSDNRWYVLAHDTDCGEVRTFALGRISVPVLTSDTFTIPTSFDPHKYLGASFSVMKGDGDYEVVIEFDAWATDLLRGRQWHPTQTVQELPGGGSQMKMRLSGLEEIERWLLSWGTHANVLRPAALAARIHTVALTLVTRYASTKSGS